MPQFKNDLARYNEFRNKLLISGTVMFLIIAGIMLFFINLKAAPLYLLVLVAVFAFTSWRTVTGQKKVYDTFVLTLDKAGISREIAGFPPIRIPYAEIAEVKKSANGIVIKSVKKGVEIRVMPFIENRAELEQQLATHAPAQAKK